MAKSSKPWPASSTQDIYGFTLLSLAILRDAPIEIVVFLLSKAEEDFSPSQPSSEAESLKERLSQKKPGKIDNLKLLASMGDSYEGDYNDSDGACDENVYGLEDGEGAGKVAPVNADFASALSTDTAGSQVPPEAILCLSVEVPLSAVEAKVPEHWREQSATLRNNKKIERAESLPSKLFSAKLMDDPSVLTLSPLALAIVCCKEELVETLLSYACGKSGRVGMGELGCFAHGWASHAQAMQIAVACDKPRGKLEAVTMLPVCSLCYRRLRLPGLTSFNRDFLPFPHRKNISNRGPT